MVRYIMPYVLRLISYPAPVDNRGSSRLTEPEFLWCPPQPFCKKQTRSRKAKRTATEALARLGQGSEASDEGWMFDLTSEEKEKVRRGEANM